MKIIFDIDGTMTDFREFIETCGLPWFYRKYGFLPVKRGELELEDILDLQNVIQEQWGCGASEAEQAAKKMLADFWVSPRFVRFSLLTRFRPGCRYVVGELRKLGFEIQVYTSRAYAAKRNVVGWFARLCTIGQLWLNGVFLPPRQIHFFAGDEDKLAKILEIRPVLVFDDKPDILEKIIRQNISAVCIAGPHNVELQSVKGCQRIAGYENIRIDRLLEHVFGKKLPCLLRAARSDGVWKKLLCTAPLIQMYFRPVVLNPSRRIVTNEAVLYAPNHRSTLDPLVILCVVKENIHWAALARFFQAEDSIFNNSKNPVLCRFTAWLFRNLEYFPIDRRTDNPDANNLQSIRDMAGFLKIDQKVGIFGEGTTRRPEGSDFGTFDDSVIALAKRTGAWIQPVTVYWASVQRRKGVIINFGEAFKVGDSRTAMEMFLQTQQKCLEESIVYFEKYLS